MSSIAEGLRKADVSSFPDFRLMSTPLEMGLWILWVAKDGGLSRQLTAEEISQVIVDVFEISMEPRAITNALNRSGKKVHVYRDNGVTSFEIMHLGKEFVRSLDEDNLTDTIYFEPGKKFNSKRILSDKVLDSLKGELKIVDPYCGERTLDVLSKHKTGVKMLTRLDNLSPANRSRLVREITDFKSEYSHVEFRDYAGEDIHDRYILSDAAMVVLGNSICSLGGKESVAVILESKSNKNIYDEMLSAFNRRWKSAASI